MAPSLFFTQLSAFALRVMLGVVFLSAVADRFGLWGAPGAPNVAWGDWQHFVAYTQKLNGYASPMLASVLSVLATALELVFGCMLIAGIYTRYAALGSGVLFTTFVVAMAFSSSIKAPLDYSVVVDAAAAFALAGMSREALARWSVVAFD
jgi:putative oxidoreductase